MTTPREPERDVEGVVERLVSRLRRFARMNGADSWTCDDAADTLEEQAATIRRLSEERDALRKALTAAAPHVCSLLCPSVKRTGEEWTHVETCMAITRALTLTPSERGRP